MNIKSIIFDMTESLQDLAQVISDIQANQERLTRRCKRPLKARKRRKRAV